MSCGSSGWAGSSTPSRRSARGWPSTSTSCCGTWPRPGIPVVQAVGRGGQPDHSRTASRWTRRSSPSTCGSRCPIAHSSPDGWTPTSNPNCSMRWPNSSCSLHLVGFAWKDCSLSNTLFRRDAGALAAYLVDAETGEMRPSLSDGQRQQDLDIAETNLAGELLDLQMSGLLSETVRPAGHGCLGDREVRTALGRAHPAADHGRRRVVAHRDSGWRRLNKLGYDVAQIQINEKDGDPHVLVQTQVVEAGHHKSTDAEPDRPGHAGEPGTQGAQRPRHLPLAGRDARDARSTRTPSHGTGSVTSSSP